MAEGVTHISLPTQEYDRGNGENRRTNEQTRTSLGLTKSRGRYCNTICMCGLSLAWVTSKNSTMLLESDSSWLTLAGPYPMLPRLSAPVSGVDCPSVDPRQPLCSPLSVQLPTALCWVASSTALSALQPPTGLCSVASSTLIRVPLPLPDTARFHVQESFVWFRAKTDSSALATYPHSATYHPLLPLSFILNKLQPIQQQAKEQKHLQ